MGLGHAVNVMAMEVAHASMTMKGLPWKSHSHDGPSMAAPMATERDFHGHQMAMKVAHTLHNLYSREDPRKLPSMAVETSMAMTSMGPHGHVDLYAIVIEHVTQYGTFG